MGGEPDVSVRRLSTYGFEITRGIDNACTLVIIQFFPSIIFVMIPIVFIIFGILLASIDNTLLSTLVALGNQIFVVVVIFLILYFMYNVWAFLKFIYNDLFSRTTPKQAILYFFVPLFNVYWVFLYFLRTALYIDILTDVRLRTTADGYRNVTLTYFRNLPFPAFLLIIYYVMIYYFTSDSAIISLIVITGAIQWIKGNRYGILWLGCNVAIGFIGMFVTEFSPNAIIYFFVVLLFYLFYIQKSVFLYCDNGGNWI